MLAFASLRMAEDTKKKKDTKHTNVECKNFCSILTFTLINEGPPPLDGSLVLSPDDGDGNSGCSKYSLYYY